ncbi:MAG: hypothetical protein AB1Z98_13545 [Nannocystaceae bacterium]
MRCLPSLPLAALACTLAAPAVASAAEPEAATLASSTEAGPTARQARIERRKQRDRIRALEVQAVGMTQLLPRPGGGADIAFAFGHPNFQARVGMLVVGVPSFRLGEGDVSNALGAGTVDVCAAKGVLRHQIRMCMGGQLGAIAHRWKGYEVPGKRATPWGAGVLKADYQVGITDHFGVVGGVGVVIPVLGPVFRARDAFGSPTPQIFPGPMAGFLSLGTTFRW